MSNMCCQICCEEQKGPCERYCDEEGHDFCKPCFADWVKASPSGEMVCCPICRKELFNAWEGWVHDGKSIVYDPESNIKKSEHIYLHGKRHGLGILYDKNGSKKSECNYENGEKHGIYREYNTTSYGNLCAEKNYVHGLLDGVAREWYAMGAIRSETYYLRGEKDGYERFWYESGKLMNEAYYQMDQYHGPVRSWNHNGQIRHESNYFYGILHGFMRMWRDGDGDGDGSIHPLPCILHKESFFEYGKMVYEKEWYRPGYVKSEFAKRVTLDQTSPNVDGTISFIKKEWEEDGSLRSEVETKVLPENLLNPSR